MNINFTEDMKLSIKIRCKEMKYCSDCPFYGIGRCVASLYLDEGKEAPCDWVID